MQQHRQKELIQVGIVLMSHTLSNEWQMVFGETPEQCLWCNECVNYRDGGENEWNNLFGDEVLESKFQDGAYVYTVVAGGGTGNDVYPPTIYVADIESAVDFHNVLMP